MKKAIYVAELNLPSTSAYSIHVMKMCDALSKRNFDTTLLTTFNNDESDIFNSYNCSNKFKINSIFKKKIKLNFFKRMIFSIKILNFIKEYDLIISRSIISSIILSIFKKKNILELHHEPKGATKFIFFIGKIFFPIKKYLKIILLHPNILKNIKIKDIDYFIEDDAVDPLDFENFNEKNEKKYNSNNILYIGSFYSGKGIEIISKIASKLNNFTFHLYGDVKSLSSKYKFLLNSKNILFKGAANYKEIPKILSQYHIVLMPYQKSVSVRSENLDVGLNMSPLKMFDYLASGKIILASDLEVYKHILKNNFNSILIDPDDIEKWVTNLKHISKYIDNYKELEKNSLKTSKIFSWNNRVVRIEKFNIS